MKLAMALMERADIQTKLNMLQNKVFNNLKIQEGDQMIEDPNELMDEYEALNNRLIKLIQQINKTNSMMYIEEYDITIAEAIVKKEQLLSLKRMYDDVIESATSYQTRISRTEIKYINVVNVKELQKKSDLIAKEYRLLDAKVQETNWITELQE